MRQQITANDSEDQWLPAGPDERALEPGNQIGLDEFKTRDLDNVLTKPSARSRLSLRLELLTSPIRCSISRAIAVERDRGTAFPWVPVCFGIGSIFYFILPREPVTGSFAALAMLLAVIGWHVGRGRVSRLALFGLALVATGAAFAQTRTQILDTKMMSRTTVATLKGIVERVEIRASGRVRYTIDISPGAGEMQLRGYGERPDRIRLTARTQYGMATVGDTISGRARLAPPPGPAFPGAYDFSFQAWFDGIGASGFFLGDPVVTPREPETISLPLTVSRIRSNISGIIRQSVPGRGGGLAAALIVGDRSGIDEETAKAAEVRSGTYSSNLRAAHGTGQCDCDCRNAALPGIVS